MLFPRLTLIILIFCLSLEQTRAALYKTLDELLADQQERVESMFQAMDLERQGFEKIKSAYNEGRLSVACEALIDYYKESKWGQHFQYRVQHELNPQDQKKVIAKADAVMRDRFTLQSITGTVPRTDEGTLDWTDKGPKNDKEWTIFLNRHYYLGELTLAYFFTNNADYAKRYAEIITDWVMKNPRPAYTSLSLQWRAMEAGRRITEVWHKQFYRMLHSDDVSQPTKILMLSSIPDHAFVCKNQHATHGNHVLVEMLALMMCAVYWPEFKESGSWMDYAVKTAEREMYYQVYPEGSQKELSNHYQTTTLFSFGRLGHVAKLGGYDLPESYKERYENMWNYLVHMTKPDGYGPLNNDADQENNRRHGMQAAREFQRDDWKYVLSQGMEGTQPEGLASQYFSWAGHVLMKSGYEPDALWSLFDNGPIGMDHLHYDKLHLSVSAYGRNFLVDTGRYNYRWDYKRNYFTGTYGHNTISVNGRRQALGNKLRHRPETSDVLLKEHYDFARGEARFFDTSLVQKHKRAVLRYKDLFWLVVDEVINFEEHDIEAFWHFDPGCSVVAGEDHSYETVDAGVANLKLIPIGLQQWQSHIEKGRDDIMLQGWWSRSYNEKIPCATAVYQTKAMGPQIFAWLLVPYLPGKAREVSIDDFQIKNGAFKTTLALDDKAPLAIHINMHEAQISQAIVISGDRAP
ncbi:MAG: alginate lyase family protein [Verrucomicrobiota bacterium]